MEEIAKGKANITKKSSVAEALKLHPIKLSGRSEVNPRASSQGYGAGMYLTFSPLEGKAIRCFLCKGIIRNKVSASCIRCSALGVSEAENPRFSGEENVNWRDSQKSFLTEQMRHFKRTHIQQIKNDIWELNMMMVNFNPTERVCDRRSLLIYSRFPYEQNEQCQSQSSTQIDTAHFHLRL